MPTDTIRERVSLAVQNDNPVRRRFLARVASGFGLVLGGLCGCRPPATENAGPAPESNEIGSRKSEGLLQDAEPATTPAQPIPDTKSEVTLSVERRLKTIIAEQLGIEIGLISRNSDLTKDFGIDSLDSVELIMEFEEEFDINIPDADAERLRTVGDVADYIVSKTD